MSSPLLWPQREREPRFSSWMPARTTIAFDTYWHFAAERQAILLRRARGEAGPWTKDSILRRHKFTNAYRAADRVSQFLIRDVIYSGTQKAEDVVFRILLFKLFNKVETWRVLSESVGELRWRLFSPEKYAKVLSAERAAGRTVYSAAYIMPSGRTTFGSAEKHRNHLALIDHVMRDGIVAKIGRTKSLADVYQVLRSYPTLGPFLAFQFAIDLNYSTVIDYDENTFVVAGPGAKDGVAKCFANTGGLSEEEIIRLVAERQEYEFASRGLFFERIGGRPLKLIDCQNLFCEVDKYSRVHHPELSGRTGRTRIKQVFAGKPTIEPLFFPPKWGINEAVERQLGQ